MSYLSNAQLAENEDFRQKVKIAMLTAAKDIAAEPETEFIAYQKRFNYSLGILNSPDIRLEAFAYTVATNVAINEASTDSDIQFPVNSVFNAMAGVIPSDSTTPVE